MSEKAITPGSAPWPRGSTRNVSDRFAERLTRQRAMKNGGRSFPPAVPDPVLVEVFLKVQTSYRKRGSLLRYSALFLSLFVVVV